MKSLFYMILHSLSCTQRMSAVQFWKCLLSLLAIVNRDGTRYTKKGEYRTNPEDINPSTPADDDVSSGSSSERSTSGGYSIFHTHLPTTRPTQDQSSPWVSDSPEKTPTTSKENESLCFPIAMCLRKRLWSSWVMRTHVLVSPVSKSRWCHRGGGSHGCSALCALTASAYSDVRLRLCFSYLGIRSTILEVS